MLPVRREGEKMNDPIKSSRHAVFPSQSNVTSEKIKVLPSVPIPFTGYVNFPLLL